MDLSQILYLLRHGETVFNTRGRYQGELDSPLTESGIAQVKQNAKLLKVIIGDSNDWRIISSPLGRALQSSKIICETIGYDYNKIEKDNRLSEVAVGSWAGLTSEEIELSWPNLFNNRDLYGWYFNSPDGESYETVVKRLTDWLESVKNEPKVIAVSHGLTGRILRGIYSDMEKEDALKLEVSQDVFFELSNKEVRKIGSEFDDFY
ncbi:histidine phosphatase family protein [Sporosarcina sp. D27]|uniref:histidine phosphatase family protein n=1 Tax=Sporosarcina sp. D27 TaxID=1382305 RepID=UPI00209D434A|nr:histidine phosphatase family protein [Sporosarcina sp. D27]